MLKCDLANLRKPIAAGLLSLAALSTVNAQKPFQISSETGVTGDINKEMVYFGCVHGVLTKENNATDIYCGMVVDSERQFTFEVNWKMNTAGLII